MEKARGKRRKRSGKAGSAPRGAGKSVKLEDLRQKLAEQVAHNAPEMVEATIGEVMKGQYQPMKYLFEMIGLFPAGTVEEKPGEDVLAWTLLRRLNLPPEPPTEPEASPEEPTVASADTVE